MYRSVGKVTAFVTRSDACGVQLLLLEHPYAGIQIPAGTVEEHEQPEMAALREAREETGLAGLTLEEYLGFQDMRLPPDECIVLRRTSVFARPEVSSFDWAYLRRGVTVRLNGRHANGFTQVTYEEPDHVPKTEYISMAITGWVPDAMLSATIRRYFFHLRPTKPTADAWEHAADQHRMRLFWAPLDDLPDLIPPQDTWPTVLHKSVLVGAA